MQGNVLSCHPVRQMTFRCRAGLPPAIGGAIKRRFSVAEHGEQGCGTADCVAVCTGRTRRQGCRYPPCSGVFILLDFHWAFLVFFWQWSLNDQKL